MESAGLDVLRPPRRTVPAAVSRASAAWCASRAGCGTGWFRPPAAAIGRNCPQDEDVMHGNLKANVTRRYGGEPGRSSRSVYRTCKECSACAQYAPRSAACCCIEPGQDQAELLTAPEPFTLVRVSADQICCRVMPYQIKAVKLRAATATCRWALPCPVTCKSARCQLMRPVPLAPREL